MSVIEEKLKNLEAKVFEALKQLAYLTKKNRILGKENRQLKTQIAEQELLLDGLKKTIEELKKNNEGSTVIRYQEKEKELRQRLQAMLAKLDELKLVD